MTVIIVVGRSVTGLDKVNEPLRVGGLDQVAMLVPESFPSLSPARLYQSDLLHERGQAGDTLVLIRLEQRQPLDVLVGNVGLIEEALDLVPQQDGPPQLPRKTPARAAGPSALTSAAEPFIGPHASTDLTDAAQGLKTRCDCKEASLLYRKAIAH